MSTCTALSEVAAPIRPRLEVAEIFRSHGEHYRTEHSVAPEQAKAMRDIQACRTAALGGHLDLCDGGCGYQRISYNSCRNRHCPKCQGLQSARWLETRFDKILPTPYFHMVFTIPHELLGITLQNRKTLYNILFRAAAQALLQLAQEWERLRAHIGFTAILHTWSQELQFHPHLHIVATGGGLDQSQTRWLPARNNFLVPVRALSKKFRGKFIDLLRQAFDTKVLRFQSTSRHLLDPGAFERLTKKLYRKKWVVYSKQPFGGAEQVFRYLGLYTHKVAISNPRLVEMDNGEVTFLARDNNNPGLKRSVTLPAGEFIRRFLLHILPPGFVKIRHYGLMAPRNATTKLDIARKLLALTAHAPYNAVGPRIQAATWMDLLFHLTRIDLAVCPTCGAKLIRHPLTSFEHPEGSHARSGSIFQDSS